MRLFSQTLFPWLLASLSGIAAGFVSGEIPEANAPAEGAPEFEEPAFILPEEADPEEPPTIIESDRLEMQASDEGAHFVFSDNVEVIGNNLLVYCDLLEVFSLRSEAAGDGAMPEVGQIHQIVASGNVEIHQEGRIATAGRADLFPAEGRIVLSENPAIRDRHGSVTGPEIVLYQGESRAVVKSEPGYRPRITLPTLPDLGVGDSPGSPPDDDEEAAEEEDDEEEEPDENERESD